MKKTTVQKTVADRRKELEAQLADLDALQEIENTINALAERYEKDYELTLEETYCDGTEEEQATNDDGELLYTVDDGWKKYTMKQIQKEGISGEVKPYHRDIWKTKKVKFEDLAEWRKPQAIAYKRLANYFRNLDITEVK